MAVVEEMGVAGVEVAVIELEVKALLLLFQ